MISDNLPATSRQSSSSTLPPFPRSPSSVPLASTSAEKYQINLRTPSAPIRSGLWLTRRLPAGSDPAPRKQERKQPMVRPPPSPPPPRRRRMRVWRNWRRRERQEKNGERRRSGGDFELNGDEEGKWMGK
ncbi:Os02g0168250, partial [Oryza sativa Japonica Group]